MDLKTFIFGMFTGGLLATAFWCLTWTFVRRELGRDRERANREFEEQARREADLLLSQQASQSAAPAGKRSRAAYRKPDDGDTA